MSRSTPSQRVALNVRAEIARQRRSGSNVAKSLGRTQAWISRRLAGHVAFSIDELNEIADELSIPLSVLIADEKASA